MFKKSLQTANLPNFAQMANVHQFSKCCPIRQVFTAVVSFSSQNVARFRMYRHRFLEANIYLAAFLRSIIYLNFQNLENLVDWFQIVVEFSLKRIFVN